MDLEQVERVNWVRTENDIGWFAIWLPGNFPPDMIDVDRLIEFWRQPDGGENQLVFVGFLRKWNWTEKSDGVELLTISGPDPIDLLNRRIIAFAANESQSSKTAPADDMIKAIVRENAAELAPVTEAGRPRRYPEANFSVAANLSNAPSLTRKFAWRQMLTVLQELAETSTNLGTPLFFDCVPTTLHAQFEFRTWTTLMGADRSISGRIAPTVFSVEAGNMIDPDLTEDWSEEWNYVWGGGQGERLDRVIDPEKDLPRIFRGGPWGKREIFQDAREEDTILGVANKAFERMQAERPRLLFTAKLLDTPTSRYGIDWKYGDKVTARYKGKEFEGRIRTVRYQLDNEGVENIDARLEVELATG